MKASSLLGVFLAILVSTATAFSVEQTITEFDQKSDGGLQWRVVDDGVMGGLSRGQVSTTDTGELVFTGVLSLENNGGFSSVRTNRLSLDLGFAEGLAMRVRGDGRTYQVRLSTDATYRGREMQFRAEFPTESGEWTEVLVPFSEFVGTWFGRTVRGAQFDPSKVTRLGILLADKKPGEFALAVDSIRAYGGEDRFTRSGTFGKERTGTIADLASEDARFSTLLAAAEVAGLVEALNGSDRLTLFAPTDAAFEKLPDGTVESLLKPENRQRLQAVLKFHVVAGSVSLADALAAGSGESLEGSPLNIAFSNGRVTINRAELLDADIEATNGVIHVIDSVLIPPEKPVMTASNSSAALQHQRTALEKIETAIAVGVPLFNAGQHERTADIYEECLAELSENEHLASKVTTRLKMAIDYGAVVDDALQRAWLYRHALDATARHILDSLNG